MSLEFEWDPEKAAENLRRHHIDFDQAALVFDDPHALETFDDTQDYGEDRFARVGLSEGTILMVVYTEREGRVRIISARKATKNEQENYRR
ncbi:MAG TPA: BrnT family toxin [Candidatus Binataceae bacterium]|nr:BrnT family toxin [Candidatus Binataceae bacterium]